MRMTRNNLVRVATAAAGICLGRIALAGSPAVQVWAEAVVQADRVHLADVASITDLDEAQARAALAVEICKSPAPGNFENVDVEQIRTALEAAKVNLANLCITGSAACRVFCPVEPAELSGGMAARDGGKGQNADARVVTLGTAVQNFLEKNLADLGGHIEVRFGAANKTVLGLAGEGMTFRVHSRTNSLLGLITLDVDVLQADKVARTIPVLAEVALYKNVVVACRPINSGNAIHDDDVGLQERRFTRAEDIGLGSPAQAVNRQARHYIDRNQMIGHRDVQALPLVRRGDSVTVSFKRGGLVVRGSAKALKEGAQGDRIDVKSEPGGQVYSAVVTGLKAVEAEPAAGATAAATTIRDASKGT